MENMFLFVQKMGPWGIVLIVLVVLLLFGGKKIPRKNILKCAIFLKNMDDFNVVNKIYASKRVQLTCYSI